MSTEREAKEQCAGSQEHVTQRVMQNGHYMARAFSVYTS
jgi:hypothetical protein